MVAAIITLCGHNCSWQCANNGGVTQNSWYDEKCLNTSDPGIYTHKQARAAFQCLVWKKRSCLGRFDAEVYRLFLGQECKRAQNMFNERQPSTHEYFIIYIASAFIF